jgi:hypothetical protein
VHAGTERSGAPDCQAGCALKAKVKANRVLKKPCFEKRPSKSLGFLHENVVEKSFFNTLLKAERFKEGIVGTLACIFCVLF